MSQEFDDYFLRIAREVASNSKCYSRKIGAVLVKDKAIIASGYNGPPRGMHPCRYTNDFGDLYIDGCPRKEQSFASGEGLHLCPAAHAERNALIQAARTGVSTKGTTLYCYCEQVCKDCASEIVNAGVERLFILMVGFLMMTLLGRFLKSVILRFLLFLDIRIFLNDLRGRKNDFKRSYCAASYRNLF
jgi:dCMP deaminase